ncbi:MAG: TonB-dependent receptor domain-containing protein, partial [Luteimonas sp.]
GPEKAKSLTAGVVFAPRNIQALRNLVLSVDYFHIKVDDAVTFTDRQTILNQCYTEGQPAFCQFVIRRPTGSGPNNSGSIAFINVGGVNAAALKTAGVDTVLQYRTSLDRFMGGLDMNARIAWTHMLKGYIIELPGAPKNRYVGEVGTPKDKVNGNVGFDTGKWGLSFSGTYIGKSLEDDQFLESRGLDRHAVEIDPEFYLDSQIRFTPSKTYEFFVGVDNMLDNKAPNLRSGTTFNVTGSETAADVYDIFGRRYYAGARLRF